MFSTMARSSRDDSFVRNRRRKTHSIATHENSDPNEMASMGSGFDMGFGSIPSAAAAFGSIVMDGDEYVRCTKCGFGGCDVRVSICGCTMHAVSLRSFCTGFT